MKLLTILLTLASPFLWADVKPSAERGRYVTRIAGCNDCHTPMYMPKNGEVALDQWMIGVPIGWKGPWGTTYASNVREKAFSMTEDAWVVYLKNLKARPPMPFFAVNEMNEVDSRSLYRFLKSLGKNDQKIPAPLPPGKNPETPFFDFNMVMPKVAKN